MKRAPLPLALGSLVIAAWLATGCAGSRGPSATSAPPPAGATSADARAAETGSTPKHVRARRDATPQAAPARAALAAADPADAGGAVWREALARDPEDAVALTRLSRLLYEHGRHAEAVELLAPVREGRVKLSNADRAAALAGLAMHEAALGRESEALDILSALPGNAAPGVAAFLAVRGADADSALTATERALRSGPESAALRNNHGIALLRAGDADSARAEFARAIALDPARPGPYYNLAILERFYRMDTDAAKRWFREAWSRSHADPDSLRPELGGTRPATVAEGSRER
jgi:tetratricopeptide (TPR) repeat protein